MNVWVSPTGGTATDVVLTVSSKQAKVSCNVTRNSTYTIESLKYARHVEITVSVPSSFTKGTVTVRALVASENAKEVSAERSFTVTKPTPSKPSTPKPSTPKPSTAKPKPAPPSGSGTPTGNLNPGTGRPNGANASPSVAAQQNLALPPIGQGQNNTQAQDPATAPMLQNAGNSQSMQNAADGPDELTFDKLASTQAAWLAALLVALGLLLTQLRLGKAKTRGVTAAEKPKAAHRKVRGPRRAR